MRRYVSLFVILLASTYLIPAAAIADDIAIDNQFAKLELEQEVEYWADTSATATLDEALEQPHWEHATDGLNFGFSDAAYWVRFVLKNPEAQYQHLLLEIDYPFLDDIQITLLEGDQVIAQQQLGDTRPATSRIIRHPHFLAPLTLAPGQRAGIIVRVQTTSTLQIPLRLWNKNHFIEEDQRATTLHTLFYGLLLAISLYHIMLFLSLLWAVHRIPGVYIHLNKGYSNGSVVA